MAKVQGSAVVGGLSGRVGTAVFAQTEAGIVLRSVPRRAGGDTEPRQRMADGLRLANRLWRGLSEGQFEAWSAYARSLAVRDETTGLLRTPKGVNVFVGLTAKFHQVHGGFTAPLDPPTGLFLGDVVAFALGANGATLQVTGDRANSPGVVTEILAQHVPGRNNAPRPRSFKSYGFHVFSQAGNTFEVQLSAGTWIVGVKFVESASGRATGIISLGRVTLVTG